MQMLTLLIFIRIDKTKKMSLFLILLIFPSSSLACYLYNVDYQGTNLNGEHQIRTTSAATCQKMCQQNQNCMYFTWLSNDYADPAYRQDCYLKAPGALIANKQGAISGPRDCGSGKTKTVLLQIKL